MGMCQVAWWRVSDPVLRCHKNVLSQDRRRAVLVGSPSETSLFMESPFHEGSAGQDFSCLQHCLNFFCINSEAKLIPLINAECRVHPSISSFFLSPIFVFLLISATTGKPVRCGRDSMKLEDTVTFLHPWRHSQQSANVKKGWHLPKSVGVLVQVMTYTLKVKGWPWCVFRIPRNSRERDGGHGRFTVGQVTCWTGRPKDKESQKERKKENKDGNAGADQRSLCLHTRSVKASSRSSEEKPNRAVLSRCHS